MRWTPGDRSNIEDRRGSAVRGAMPLGIGGLLVVLARSWFTGVDFLSLVGGGVPQTQIETTGTSGPVETTPEEERIVDMVDSVMADAEAKWSGLLDGRYQSTTAVLFREARK